MVLRLLSMFREVKLMCICECCSEQTAQNTVMYGISQGLTSRSSCRRATKGDDEDKEDKAVVRSDFKIANHALQSIGIPKCYEPSERPNSTLGNTSEGAGADT